MPELPEVETVARGLRAALVGRTITDVKVLWTRSVVPPDPSAFARRLTGQTVTGVGRRGKWVVMALSGGDTLLVHLRMSGRLLIESEPCLDDRHLRVLIQLDDGRRLSFVDQRKFGRMIVTDDPDQVLGDLGPEPLSDAFTPERFGEMLAQRRGRIKPLLLNQRFLAGLGNIYTDEALWQARIHPLRPANTLTPAEVQRLHQAIQTVLAAAIARRMDRRASSPASWQSTGGRKRRARAAEGRSRASQCASAARISAPGARSHKRANLRFRVLTTAGIKPRMMTETTTLHASRRRPR
jgi:formamidopyrimidine-DNA glycosylase